MLTSSRNSAVAVALCVTVRRREAPPRFTMRHYAANQFHPIPLASAPKAIHETFALARGIVPVASTMGALLLNRRQHSSFAGSPKEFLQDIENSPTLVFFYKPVCEPCKVIRDRLIHTVSHPFESIKSASPSSLRRDAQPTGYAPVAHSSGTSHGSHDAESDASPSVHAAGSDPNTSASPEVLSLDDIIGATKQSMTPPGANVHATEAEENTEGLCEEDAVICHRIKKQLRDELSDYADRIRIVFVDTNANPRVTALHDIRSLPTFVAYVHGRPLGRVEGAHEEELMALLRRLVDAADKGTIEPDGTL